MKIALLTLGCRTNQAESAHIEKRLQALGHEMVNSTSDAEICIINTCSVTAKADYQSRQLIARALKTDAEVIVTGCYAELNSSLLSEKNPDIKVVLNAEKDSIINMIPFSSSSVTLDAEKSNRHRPVIKVQDGCNNECSYCIIPRARGSSVSIRPEKVIEEVVFYNSLGFQEVVISGIHLGMYGRDLNQGYNLAKLLELLLLKTSIKRIRVSSIEINELSDELLEVFCDERICRHLHLPLQSGDDSILQLMNRSYKTTEYIRAIANILCKFNNIALGTDLIVGFPGESSHEFLNTLSLVESLQFSYLHVFPYSDRPGTKASLMSNKVPASEKKIRVKQMREIGLGKKISFINNNVGIDHEILIESLGDDVITGTTSNFIRVHIVHDDSFKAGRLVRVRLTGTQGEAAVGFPLRFTEP
jgi:threonylcarbamoyladenosine tRNA methylthiotransferase MtaB